MAECLSVMKPLLSTAVKMWSSLSLMKKYGISEHECRLLQTSLKDKVNVSQT